MSKQTSEKFFGLRAPCADCPFACGSSVDRSLSTQRKRAIAADLIRGETFVCHKTLDHEAEDTQHKALMCAGARDVLAKHGQLHHTAKQVAVEQIARRLNLSVPELKENLDTYPDFDSWINSYNN